MRNASLSSTLIYYRICVSHASLIAIPSPSTAEEEVYSKHFPGGKCGDTRNRGASCLAKEVCSPDDLLTVQSLRRHQIVDPSLRSVAEQGNHELERLLRHHQQIHQIYRPLQHKRAQ